MLKHIHLDCSCGASGDMLVGALLDLGLDFKLLRETLLSLGVSGFDVTNEKLSKKGVMASKFDVVLDDSVEQPHRHLRHVLEIIEKGDIPDTVKAASAETFRRIAVAEAAVHGTTPEKVHFHEVGAVDSIVDIVGANLALHMLGMPRVTASPLALGTGTVQCAHGVLPVPAPATARLIEGCTVYGGNIEGELLTPTGAALVTQWATAIGPMPSMRLEKTGFGAGTRDLSDRPNVLRIFLGQIESALPATEEISVIEVCIDDMNPELLAPVGPALFAAGARDVFMTPVTGKKGRIAHHITVLSDREQVDKLVQVLFQQTTTFGVRMRNEQRICLERQWEKVHTRYGDIQIKVGYLDGHVIQQSPEFEDCRRQAEAHDVPVTVVYTAAMNAIMGGNDDA